MVTQTKRKFPNIMLKKNTLRGKNKLKVDIRLRRPFPFFFFAKNCFSIGEFRNENRFFEFCIDFEIEGGPPPPNLFFEKLMMKIFVFYKLNSSYMCECMVKIIPKTSNTVCSYQHGEQRATPFGSPIRNPN